MKLFFFCLALMLPFFIVAQPLHQPGLTVAYNDGDAGISLKWHHADNRVQAYQLQHSRNGLQWTTLWDVTIKEPEYYSFLSFRHSNAPAGSNYYRLKMICPDDPVQFTETILAWLGNGRELWKLYPNPVKDVLHLQYNGQNRIGGVIQVSIQRQGGQVYHRLRFSSQSRQIRIPVSNLGSGIYMVQIVIDGRQTWAQQFVK